MTLVIDASVALKWVLLEERAAAAEVLRSEDLTAPEIWLVEAANALWVKARRGHITFEQGEAALAVLRSSPVASTPIASDIDAAMRLAGSLSHPVYDCLYLALALRTGSDVVTADARFASAAAKHPAFAQRVRLLGAS